MEKMWTENGQDFLRITQYIILKKNTGNLKNV